MLEILSVLVLGCLLGIITGLLPGLHPNTIIVLSLPIALALEPPLLLFIAFITGMSVVHTFTSFIPTLLVGSAETETALSVRPGQHMLAMGRAYDAVLLTVAGGLVAAIVAVCTLPLLILIVPPVYSLLSSAMHLVLSLVVLLMIYRERNRKHATIIVLLAGTLGMLVLNSPAANTHFILFPVFAGMFSIATILITLQQRFLLPPQSLDTHITLRHGIHGGITGYLSGLLAGFLPGIGPAQSAQLLDTFLPSSRHRFLVALGGINTADLFISLIALYVIGNPRSGAAVAIQQLVPDITLQFVVQIVGMVLIAAGIGAIATKTIAYYTIANLSRVPYRTLLYSVVLFITAGTLLLTSWYGFIVLLTATGIGVIAYTSNVRLSICMAVLLIPTIAHYAGLTI